jgi:hypothetical protein
MELARSATDTGPSKTRVLPSGRVIVGMAFLMTIEKEPEYEIFRPRLNNSDDREEAFW